MRSYGLYNSPEAWRVAQRLRAQAALSEDKGSIPSTHMLAQNSISRRPDNLFCPRDTHKIIPKNLNNSPMGLCQPGSLRIARLVLGQAGRHSTSERALALSVAGMGWRYTPAILKLSRLRLALAT